MINIIDSISKKLVGYTKKDVLKIVSTMNNLQNELSKLPLQEQYKYGLLNKKGFILNDSIFIETEIDNSFNKNPSIEPINTCIALIGDSGSGRSLLTSKILKESKKILYFGSIDQDYYNIESQFNFKMSFDKDIPFFNLGDTTLLSDEIKFLNSEKTNLISICLSSLSIIDSQIDTCVELFKSLISKAIKNDYTLVFDSEFVHLDQLLNTNKFSNLITFAYDKISIKSIESNFIDDIKIVITLENEIFKKTLLDNIDCTSYIDEIILITYDNKNHRKYPEFINNYFKYNIEKNIPKIGDFIHFKKLTKAQ